MHSLSPKELAKLLERVGCSYLPKEVTKKKMTKQQIFIIANNKKKYNKKA
tara:strand:+ start:6749 stop:6898 length:150 start_codon:yes stop_codon:yes gene_type:complete